MERWLRGKINRVWWGTGLKSLTFVFFVFIDVVLAVLGLCCCVVFLSSCNARSPHCSGL